MKKIIAFLIAALLTVCLLLSSCNFPAGDIQIVGEWRGVDHRDLLIFHEDGTCEYVHEGWENEVMAWRYDEEKSCLYIDSYRFTEIKNPPEGYSLGADETYCETSWATETHLFELSSDSVYVELYRNGEKRFYHPDSYEEARCEYGEALRDELKEATRKAEKISAGDEYVLRYDRWDAEITLKLLNVTCEDQNVNLEFECKNTGKKPFSQSFLITPKLVAPCPYSGLSQVGGMGLWLDEEGNELMVPAGETKKGFYRIDLSKADFSFEEARSFYGDVFGILGWGAEIEDSVDVPGHGSFPIYGDYKYYIDLEEFLS